MRHLIVLATIVALFACGTADQQSVNENENRPLAQSKNPEIFNQAFGQFLNSYYSLKDALVLTNDTLAATHALTLAQQADSLSLKELQSDSSIVETAILYVQTIAAEAKGLAGEKDVEAKRKSFQMISDNMYDLVRTVRYDREVVYHQYCPMAFNDAGAFWLSKSDDIKNPYFGKKMLTCGEVKDTIDFTR